MVDFASTTTSATPVTPVTSTAATSKSPGLREKLSILFNSVSAAMHATSERLGTQRKAIFNKKKIGTIVFVLIVAVAVISGIRVALSTAMKSTVSQNASVAADAITVPIEREFSFNVYDKDKKLSDPVKYTLTSAQLSKQIIIKGQKATAVKGRTFLILNLKLINEFDKSLFLNTRNYVRVQPAGTTDNLAPEIHNDTVEAQPLSTKLTRIGLPVDENVKEFTLFVGELDGQKEQIVVTFP